MRSTAKWCPEGDLNPHDFLSLRILSPLQALSPRVAPRRTDAHGPITSNTYAFGLDCIEAQEAHRIQAGSATQTATGKFCYTQIIENVVSELKAKISIALTVGTRYFGSLLRTWQSLPVLLGVVEQCNAQHGGRQHALFGRKSFEQHELFVGQSGADLIGSLLSHQYFVAKDTSCIDYSVTFNHIRLHSVTK